MPSTRNFAIIQSPKLSGTGKIKILYKTRTDSPKKAARRYAKSLCKPQAKSAKSRYCKYVVHVLDMNKMSQANPLVRKYDVTTYKFSKIKHLDIGGGVVIPRKFKWTVRYNTSFRLPMSVQITNSRR